MQTSFPESCKKGGRMVYYLDRGERKNEWMADDAAVGIDGFLHTPAGRDHRIRQHGAGSTVLALPFLSLLTGLKNSIPMLC